jgi:hypothetical protein
MSNFILLVLLQFSLFGIKGDPMADTKVYVNNAASGELIAFSKIGFSGAFEFSNLDPGNYILSMELDPNTVWFQERKKHQKFETDLLIAFNREDNIYGWKNDNGNLIVEFNELSKIAEALMPKFSEYGKSEENCNDETDSNNDENTKKKKGKSLFEKATEATQKNNEKQPRIDILHFTVIDQFGTIGGEIQSISQKDYHKTFVGNDEIKYEDAGKVIVIEREE